MQIKNLPVHSYQLHYVQLIAVYRLCKLNSIQAVQKSKLYSFNSLSCVAENSSLLGCDTVQMGKTDFSNIVMLFFSTAKTDPEDGAIKTIRNARNYSLNCKAPHFRKHETLFTNYFYIIVYLFIYLLVLYRHLYEIIHINWCKTMKTDGVVLNSV